MEDDKRREGGMTQRRKVLGNEWVDKSIANRNAFNTEFQDLITRYAWGDIWTRPHFDHRTRRVLVIGTLVALGQWDEFRLHVRAALTEGGFTSDDIKEIILQQAIYCGVPAANHAVKEAYSIVAELGLLEGELARGRAVIRLRLHGTFDQHHDAGAEHHQQFGRMHPQCGGLAGQPSHQEHARADHGAHLPRRGA